MGIVFKSLANEAASNRQDGDAQHRATELDLSHSDQAVAATDDLFFKERGDARCSDQITYSSLESSTSSNLKHDSILLPRVGLGYNESVHNPRTKKERPPLGSS